MGGSLGVKLSNLRRLCFRIGALAALESAWQQGVFSAGFDCHDTNPSSNRFLSTPIASMRSYRVASADWPVWVSFSWTCTISAENVVFWRVPIRWRKESCTFACNGMARLSLVNCYRGCAATMAQEVLESHCS